MKQGFKLVYTHKGIFLLIIATALFLVASGMHNSIFVAFNEQHWEFSSKTYGFLVSVVGVGGIIGGIITGFIPRKIINVLLPIILIAKSVMHILMIFKVNYIVISSILLFSGALTTIFYTLLRVKLLSYSKESERGRVFGFVNTSIDLFMIIGLGTSGLLIAGVGFETTILFIAVMMLVAGLVTISIDKFQISEDPAKLEPENQSGIL